MIDVHKDIHIYSDLEIKGLSKHYSRKNMSFCLMFALILLFILYNKH